MRKISVAFLDSGIGGLPYLSWLRERRSDLSLSYLADTANFPYGELEEKELVEAVTTAANKIFQRLDPDILAIVCNTASVAALEEVRQFAPCPVIGTVPAVKPAAEGNTSKSIGLLATRNTVNSPYVDRLVEAFAPHRKIIRVAAGDIVRFVERSWLDEGMIGAENVLNEGLSRLQNEDIESLIIGCTHFLHVIEPIQNILKRVRIVDSRDGVVRRILSLYENGVSQDQHSELYITQSGNVESRYRRFAQIFDLEWAGVLS